MPFLSVVYYFITYYFITLFLGFDVTKKKFLWIFAILWPSYTYGNFKVSLELTLI